MSLPSERPRRGLLILDTGPIRELVVFHAVDQFKFGRLRNDLLFIKDRESYDNCGKFIASFKRKVTSASVVAELHYWIRSTQLAGHAKLWNRVYEEFRDMGVGEEGVRLVDMDPDLVARYGPVDVSLIELARRHPDARPLVLTADHELCGECHRAGLPASHIQEIT